MAFLRRPRHFVQLLLTWFVLSLGVAVAAPLVQPQSLEMVCSAAGMVRLVAHTSDGAVELSASAMHCPLCLVADAPPPVVTLGPPSPLPVAQVVPTLDFPAHTAQTTVLPWQARAPPLHS